jgi:protease-4
MATWSLAFARFGHAVGAPIRAVRARRVVPSGSFVQVVIDGPVVLVSERIPWWRRRQTSRAVSLERINELVGLVSKDPKVKGLVVELRSLRAGAAVATSLRTALARFGDTGKPLVAYLPMGAGTREMLVASAASRIIVGPESSILPLGVAVEARYFRRALDKIGVLPEIFARGEFKTAGESLARDSMSEEQREQLGAILDVLEDELLSSLSSGRRISREQARALVDGGPYRASDAVARYLADAKGYDDELPHLVTPESTEPARFVPAGAYLSVRRAASRPRRVGIVHVRGPIVSRAPFGMGRMAVDERIMGALRKARESRAVDGVILLIDSPGGSVLASDRIHHEVSRLAEKKPVVAYMANVAASGGYYVACAAHAIVAQTTTITGSIGVVAAHLVLSPLLDKLGIVTELVKRGARADMLSASRPLDQGEREAMTLEIDGFYRDFVSIVAKGRKRPPEEIEKLARGRVYSGVDAKGHGLVDRLGDLNVALDWLREQLGAKDALHPTVIKAPRAMPKPPEIPAPFVGAIESLGGGILFELAALALGVGPTERAFVWCETRGLPSD